MKAADLLAALQGASNFGGAPFGMDLIGLIEALHVRGGVEIYVARDDKMAAAALKTASFIDPRLDIVDLPGWDTLPYDRVSPSPGIAARRCAGLARLAQRSEQDAPMLVVTTASSLVQRVPPLKTMQASSIAVSVGNDIDEAALTKYLQINGYIRTGTVREKGEYAIRGGIIDVFPPTNAEPIRMDLFGDTLDKMRTFDPETQRSTGDLDFAAFAPVSEILFSEGVLSKFREKYLGAFGHPSGDPMYEAARAEIRRQGLESWLPLFHERLDTLFDYARANALFGVSNLSGEAAGERLNQAQDYYEARLKLPVRIWLRACFSQTRFIWNLLNYNRRSSASARPAFYRVKRPVVGLILELGRGAVFSWSANTPARTFLKQLQIMCKSFAKQGVR